MRLSRDHVIAAGLAGAVVVVVGYASGLGLRPGGTAGAATPPVVADGGHQAPQPTQQPQIPSAVPPANVPVSPLPADPVGGEQPSMPSMPQPPGDVGATPAPDPGMPGMPGTTEPTPPPGTTTPPPPPPGTDVPACQPGAAQQVLDTVGGLPLLGAVTTGLGVTGPDGLGARILGYCRTADGSLQLAMVPVPAGVPGGR